MKYQQKNAKYKRIALFFCLCVLIIWAVLGTGTSLAWFSDATPEMNNIFNFSDFDVDVSYELTDGTWKDITGETEIFEKEARYEPGYVKVVYLKVENKGDRPFRFGAAVNVNGCIVATNVFGGKIMLHDYLKLGMTFSDSPAEMRSSVPDREVAKKIAQEPLHKYYQTGKYYNSDVDVLAAGATKYIALIVRMPEEVGNIANYRGDTAPYIELGITVKADQVKN